MSAPLTPDEKSRITNAARETLDAMNRVDRAYERMSRLIREHGAEHPDVSPAVSAACDNEARRAALVKLMRVLATKAPQDV